MNKLELLCNAIKQLEDLGLPISSDQQKAVFEAENEYIDNEFIPLVKNTAKDKLSYVHNPVEIIIKYTPGSEPIVTKRATALSTFGSSERKKTEADVKRDNARLEFWTRFIEYNKSIQGFYSSFSPSIYNWLGKSLNGIPGGSIGLLILKDGCRAELYIDTGDKVKNEKNFDTLFAEKEEIETKLGSLDWQRLDDKLACRISVSNGLFYHNKHDEMPIFEFFVDMTQRMRNTFGAYASLLKNQIQ